MDSVLTEVINTHGPRIYQQSIETVIVTDCDGEVVASADGDEDGAFISYSPGSCYGGVLIHNHPIELPLHAGDLLNFRSGFKHIVAVSPSEVHIATLPKPLDFIKMWSLQLSTLFVSLQEYVNEHHGVPVDKYNDRVLSLEDEREVSLYSLRLFKEQVPQVEYVSFTHGWSERHD